MSYITWSGLQPCLPLETLGWMFCALLSQQHIAAAGDNQPLGLEWDGTLAASESCFVPVGIAAGMWHTILHSKCRTKRTLRKQTSLFLALCATGKALNRSVPGPVGSAACVRWGRTWLLSLTAVIALCSQVTSVLSQQSPKAPFSDRVRKLNNVCFAF